MKISIPQPCHENWNEMLPEEKGRFCLSCQKCVYDFTKMSDLEIKSHSKQKDICVRLTQKQINRINSNQNFLFPKWFRYSSFMMALGLSSLSFAQNQTEIKYTTSQIEELLKKDTVITIQLQAVYDFQGKEPIANAKVYLYKKKKKYSTLTDENGYFELEIPTKYLDDFLIIDDGNGEMDYQIRYILNQKRIGYEIILGKVDYKKTKSISFLNSIYQLIT